MLLQTQDRLAKITEDFVSWLVHTDALQCKRDVCRINMQAGDIVVCFKVMVNITYSQS